MAIKYDLKDKRVGKLKVIRLCTIDERPSKSHGNYWLCECDCGNECKVPTAYLTGNGNFTQTSCGCDRKKKAFQATTYINVDEAFLNLFQDDFEKYLFLHKSLRITGNTEKIHEECRSIWSLQPKQTRCCKNSLLWTLCITT